MVHKKVLIKSEPHESVSIDLSSIFFSSIFMDLSPDDLTSSSPAIEIDHTSANSHVVNEIPPDSGAKSDSTLIWK